LVPLLAACSYVDRGTPVYRPPGIARAPDAHSGEQLFQRDCAWCHASTGAGTDNGPNIVSGTGGPADVDFVLSTGRMPLSDPDERMARGPTNYTDQQIADIVGYVRGLRHEGPDVPTLSLTDAPTSEGEVLYQENCAACHSTTGIGGALTEGRADTDTSKYGTGSLVAPSLLESSPTEVAEAIRVGPGAMPVFGDDVIDQAQLNTIVRYVAYLKTPDDRGGAPIGRIGPVAEGAVGWIIGLGLLVLFIRWIGTKRGEL
jgi:ubiquinol-cytochrome c reductase cytochrome c subunit